MREGKPSTTAAIVAFGRGLGVSDALRDRSARHLLPPAYARLLDVLERSPGRPLVRAAVRVATAGLVDHTSLRMHAIDAAVKAAVGRGCRQLVTVGAGLDARPWRMACLAGVHAFEVDHPATQDHKKARVAALQQVAQSVRHVAVDLGNASLPDALEAAGHDRTQPTMWVWEGVTMYLPPEAVAQTLADLRLCSAPGSALAMTYLSSGRVMVTRAASVMARTLFRALGEPLLGVMDREAAAAHLARAGFELHSDTASADWAAAYPGFAISAGPFSAERLALAGMA